MNTAQNDLQHFEFFFKSLGVPFNVYNDEIWIDDLNEVDAGELGGLERRDIRRTKIIIEVGWTNFCFTEDGKFLGVMSGSFVGNPNSSFDRRES